MKSSPRNIAVAASLTLTLMSLLACTTSAQRAFKHKIERLDPNTPSPQKRAERPRPDKRGEEVVQPPREPLRAGEPSSSGKKHAHRTGDLGRTPLELSCDGGDSQACYEFARASLSVSTSHDVTSRAAAAMFRACDMEHPRACYEYALMSWLEVGVRRNPQEIAFSMERGRRLGDDRALESYEEMMRSARPRERPIEDTMAHYERACEISLVPACVELEVLNAPHHSSASAEAEAPPRP